MKILFLSDATSIHTVRWVNAISQRGHQVHLVFKFDDAPKDNEISNKVFLHQLKYSGTKGYFLNAKQLKKIIRSVRPDIINAHYASGYGTLARIAKLQPLVLSVWGSDVYEFPYQSKLKMKILKDNLNFANILASTSNAMVEQVNLILGKSNKRVYVTPFGVDLFKFSKNNCEIAKPEGKVIIGNIKSLKKIYGIEYLIEAIKILIDNLNKNNKIDIIDNLEVHIYGDGDQKDYLKNLTIKFDIEKHIRFMGKIPNSSVPDALEKMDIFCATSNQESFGVSLVEAMAMEKPIVATDVPGFIEVVEDGVTGIIVQRKNSEKIAEALEKLILNNDLRKVYGNNGRKRVERLYNWENNVDTMIDIFNKLVNLKKEEAENEKDDFFNN